QQAQAAARTAEQTDFLGRQKQIQNDFGQNLRSADATQATVAQEELLRQLGAGLALNEDRRLQTASEERLSAQDMASQMGIRDLDFQKLEYQALMDAYNAATGAAQTDFSNQLDLFNLQSGL